MKLSKGFYELLNSVPNIGKLPDNDPKVIEIRNMVEEEFSQMRESRMREEEKVVKIKKVFKPRTYKLYQGNELIVKGTAVQIAVKTGLKISSISQMGTPSWMEKINKDKDKYVVRIGGRR